MLKPSRKTFNIKIKKLAVVLHVPWTTQNLVILHYCSVEDIPVAVAIMVKFFNYLLFQ